LQLALSNGENSILIPVGTERPMAFSITAGTVIEVRAY